MRFRFPNDVVRHEAPKEYVPLDLRSSKFERMYQRR